MAEVSGSNARHNRYSPSGEVDITSQWTYAGPGGRPSQRHTIVSGFGTGSQGFDIGYGHDTWGNQSELTFPYYAGCRYSSWERMQTTYDGEWATSARLVQHDGTETLVGAFSYHPSGRVSELDYGNGFAWWRELADLDKMARPARMDLYVNGALEPAGTSGDFGFDAAGNVYKIGGKRYSYDGLSRLEKYWVWGDTLRALSFKEGYVFDRWGNMTRADRPGVGGLPTPYLSFTLEDADVPLDVPDSNRISSLTAASKAAVALTWNERGNLKHQGIVGDLHEKDFEWTADDRLKQSTDGATDTVWRYAYDAAGERVMRWSAQPSGLNATIFLRDEGGQVVSEWDYAVGGASFNVSRDYVSAAGRTIAQVDYGAPNGTVEYFSPDHLGSTRVVFNDAGQVLDSMDYMPFGELDGGGTPGATHLFTGQERDLGTTSSELDFFHQRYYSPDLFRFTSIDPVKGNTASSQSHNRYSFVENNPLKFVDANGESLSVVYDFSKSGLSERTQTQVADAVRQRFVNAGVKEVGSYFKGGSFKQSQSKGYDVVTHVKVTSAPIDTGRGKEPFGVTPGTIATLGNKSTVSTNLAPAGEEAIVNFLTNVISHEVGHGSGTMTEYNWDADPSTSFFQTGDPGTTMQTGVSADVLGEAIREFSAEDAAKLRTGMNEPEKEPDP